MKSFQQLINDFGTAVDAYSEFERSAPVIMGKIAVEFMRKNFEIQGFQGESRWKDRKAATNANYDRAHKGKGNLKGSVMASNKRILWQTGRLRLSIKAKQMGKSVFVGVFGDKTLIDIAKIHNEGLQGKAWGKYSFTMPERRFLGWSPLLKNLIVADFLTKRKQIFIKFKQ